MFNCDIRLKNVIFNCDLRFRNGMFILTFSFISSAVFGRLATLTLCNNFCIIDDSNLIFGMHVYLMELHI